MIEYKFYYMNSPFTLIGAKFTSDYKLTDGIYWRQVTTEIAIIAYPIYDLMFKHKATEKWDYISKKSRIFKQTLSFEDRDNYYPSLGVLLGFFKYIKRLSKFNWDLSKLDNIYSKHCEKVDKELLETLGN